MMMTNDDDNDGNGNSDDDDDDDKDNDDDDNYQLMSLTYRICFISLPIPVTGPEWPSKFLVLSW